MSSSDLLGARFQPRYDRLRIEAETRTLEMLLGGHKLSAVSILKKLDEVESACIATLEKAGCWDNGGVSLYKYLQKSRAAEREKHMTEKAVKMKIVRARHLLCLVRHLRGLMRGSGETCLDAIRTSLLIGASVEAAISAEYVAKGKGSHRKRTPEESDLTGRSIALYERIRRSSGKDVPRDRNEFHRYEKAARDINVGRPRSVWYPNSKQAFRQKLYEWRRRGLIE